ncbi:two-component system regulatory protein YycI [Virgibacillus salinus]|uniref:Two-component signal transduction system YycFG, regulatory protein YycI n=1 Tax=Virgibacillus salinus TaxID=553311 RepID=A0A1H0XQZ2_9BACI|nr:two-component system regulatory protein YycI [Virgibacillus salinus]SDQ05263.1 Two-component signal transduction system YycFG, regulatory protein YycI [Virgibacillus salinus]
MQWRQIKTLFILCFLILNAYLLFMFFDKLEELDYGLAENEESSTFKEQLENENITISADLPEEELDKSYISVNQKSFTDEEVESLNGLDGQQSEVINGNFIVSLFEEPVTIPENADNTLISEIVKSKILLSDNYTYGTWNEEMNILVFFQEKNGLPIYYNQNGIVVVYLNNENEMIFYTQTVLGEAESPTDTESLIKPISAIQVLFDGNRLLAGDEITDVNMGFHTRIPLSSGEQLFAPTWTITVNENENFYVNAIENLVFSSDEMTFLTQYITDTTETLQELKDGNEVKEFVLNHLNTKLIDKSE